MFLSLSMLLAQLRITRVGFKSLVQRQQAEGQSLMATRFTFHFLDQEMLGQRGPLAQLARQGQLAQLAQLAQLEALARPAQLAQRGQLALLAQLARQVKLL
jgi:hypothetical protein